MLFDSSPRFSEVLQKRLSLFSLDAYFKLPDDRYTALEMVWNTLAMQGRVYAQKNNGAPPTVVIDSVDRLAKCDQKMFTTLISLAKDSVNLQQLNVVFVSLGGYVLSLLQKHSEKSRSGWVIHLGDLNSDEAEDCCPRMGLISLWQNTSPKVTGGRLIFLKQSIGVKIDHFYSSKDELLNNLQMQLFEIARADAEAAGIFVGSKHADMHC